jgi:hypothetical protein
VSQWKKYIHLPVVELYDLATDPSETQNLAARNPEILERMRGLLRGLRASDRGWGPSEEASEVKERLKSLGYLAAGTVAPKERYTPDDDPKRLIALSSAIDEVLRLYRAGEVEHARSLCEEIVKRRPMPIALLHLAFLRRESGDLSGGVEGVREPVSPNFIPVFGVWG